MSFYNVDEALSRATSLNLPSHVNYAKKAKEIIEGEEGALGIEGVPGAGKTTQYAYLVAETMKEELCDQQKLPRRLVIYIAPTNDLLIEFLMKTYKYLSYSCNKHVFAKRTRIYGSKISASQYYQMLKYADDEVGLVISTDWQRVSYKIRTNKEQVILIDEASRLTLARLFILIADKFAQTTKAQEVRRIEKHVNMNVNGMVVIGDLNQAIGLLHEERRYLILERLLLLAETGDKVYKAQLNVSYRLPKPTEEPLNHGYYVNNKIEALGQPIKKLLEETDLDRLFKNIGLRYKKEVYEVLKKAFVDGNAFVHIEDKYFQPGDTYDPDRTRFVAELVMSMSLLQSHLKLNKKITMLSPYSKMTMAPKLYLSSQGVNIGINAGSVVSFLGRESDIIVSIMGKEYSRRMSTYYFQDPYIFSVQMSRHKNLFINVGCLECLKESLDYELKMIKKAKKRESQELLDAYDRMKKTIQYILDNFDKYIIKYNN